MARILPPSVFKANFQAAEFNPTQSQRVGERFATPEGLKVGVDVIDRVGGTVADAVTRFSRGRAALARARKQGDLGEDTGMFGTQYLTLNEEEKAFLDQRSYGAGQRRVAGARDRRIIGPDGKLRFLSAVDDRAAGYEQMRRAFDRPGSGRLLGDPTRDPSRLISEDYKRLASASPLPKPTTPKGLDKPQLEDVRARFKINKPVVDDLNTAMLLKQGVASSELLKKGFDPNNLTADQVQELQRISGGQLTVYVDESGDKTTYSVQVKPNEDDLNALRAADANNRPSEVKAIRAGLNARAITLLNTLGNPNLEQASADVNRYSELLDKVRAISSSNPNDPRLADLRLELLKYSGPLSQASGNLGRYLGITGQRAEEAAAEKSKKASDEVGLLRERYDELERESQVAPLNSAQQNELINLRTRIRKLGGTLPASASSTQDRLMSLPDDGTAMSVQPTAVTASTEQEQKDAWTRATEASGRQVAQPQAAPPGPTPEQLLDTDLEEKVNYLRQNNVPENVIANVFPGYQAGRDYKKQPLTLMERIQTAGSNVATDPRLSSRPSPKRTRAQKDAIRREAAKRKLRGEILERRSGVQGPRQTRGVYAMDAKQGSNEYFDLFKERAKTTGPKPLAPKQNVSFEEFDKILKKHKTESGAGERRRIYQDYYRGEYYEPNKVKYPNKKEKERLKQIVIKAAKNNNVEPWLMLALVRKESGFRPTVVSNSNALGIAQTIPSTFKSVMGENVSLDKVFDPEIGAEAGARYIARRIKQYAKKGRSRKEQLQMALAAYNAGAGKLKKHGLKVLLSDRFATIKSGTNKGKGATRLYVEGILANMPKEGS